MDKNSVVVKIEGFSLKSNDGENVQNSTLNQVTIKNEPGVDIDNHDINFSNEKSGESKPKDSINQYEKILIKNERDFIKPELIINDLENAFDIESDAASDVAKSKSKPYLKKNHKTKFIDNQDIMLMKIKWLETQIQPILLLKRLTKSEIYKPMGKTFIELIINDLENAFDIEPDAADVAKSKSKPILIKIQKSIFESKKKVKMDVKKPFNFKCLLCSKCFTGFSNLSNHIRTHTREKPYFCKICPKSFSEIYNLRHHKYIHKGKKPFSCKVCHKSFARKGHLNRHLLTHSNEKPFSCPICKKTFNQKANLKRHEESRYSQCKSRNNNNNKPEKCSVCSILFKNSKSLTLHSRVHKEILNLPHKCTTCKDSFSSKEYLKIHFHNKHTDNHPYTCTVCSKKFTKKSILNRHSSIHDKEMGKKGHLKCPNCPKTFFRTDNLKLHSRIHSNVKEFSCPFCKVKFRHRQNLNGHLKSKH